MLRRLSALIILAAAAAALAVTQTDNPPPARQIVDPEAPGGPRITLTREQQDQADQLGGFSQTPLSMLKVAKQPMRYGEFVWNDAGVPPGPVSVRVDLRTQILSVFRGGHEIGTAIILFGADAKQTPLGTFPILWRGKNHRSSLYDAPMPFTLRLTGDGVAIHGSDVRWGAATHGCVGVPTDFARQLYSVANLGDPVSIVRTVGLRKPRLQDQA